MKVIFLLGAVALMSCTYGASTGSDLVAEVRTAEARRFEAMTRDDVDTLRSLLADDLVYVHSSGQVESKQQFLANISDGSFRYKTIKPSNVVARVYPPLAVVTGESDMVVSARGAERSVKIRYTAVYRRADANRWQLVSWQSTRIGQ